MRSRVDEVCRHVEECKTLSHRSPFGVCHTPPSAQAADTQVPCLTLPSFALCHSDQNSAPVHHFHFSQLLPDKSDTFCSHSSMPSASSFPTASYHTHSIADQRVLCKC